MKKAIAKLGTAYPGMDPIGTLSPRELEVVRLYVGGMKTSEVARHLKRSVNTVSTQKHSAMRKLGVKSDSELFDYANTRGLKA